MSTDDEPTATPVQRPAADSDATGLTVLGGTVRHAIDHVEVFPAPANVSTVTFTIDELSSMCPVTRQPDLSSIEIAYEPDSGASSRRA